MKPLLSPSTAYQTRLTQHTWRWCNSQLSRRPKVGGLFRASRRPRPRQQHLLQLPMPCTLTEIIDRSGTAWGFVKPCHQPKAYGLGEHFAKEIVYPVHSEPNVQWKSHIKFVSPGNPKPKVLSWNQPNNYCFRKCTPECSGDATSLIQKSVTVAEALAPWARLELSQPKTRWKG